MKIKKMNKKKKTKMIKKEPRGHKINLEEQQRENEKMFKKKIRKIGNKFVCILCKKFKTKGLNIAKARSHSYFCGEGKVRKRKKKDKKVPCLLCDMVFTSMKCKDTHHAQQHNTKPIKCAECGSKFTLRGSLTRHLEEVHSSVAKKYTCKTCQFKTSRAYDLKKHEKYCRGSRTIPIPSYSPKGWEQGLVEEQQQEGVAVARIMGSAWDKVTFLVHERQLDLYELETEPKPRLRLLQSYQIGFNITTVTPHPLHRSLLGVSGPRDLVFLDLNSVGGLLKRVEVLPSLLPSSFQFTWIPGAGYAGFGGVCVYSLDCMDVLDIHLENGIVTKTSSINIDPSKDAIVSASFSGKNVFALTFCGAVWMGEITGQLNKELMVCKRTDCAVCRVCQGN